MTSRSQERALSQGHKRKSRLHKHMSMKGKVKWFNDQKGYGFITPEDGTADVFVHHTSILGEGFKTLAESQTVEYDVLQSDKGPKAANVQKL